MDDDAGETRRRILQLTGIGSIVAATGCLGEGDQPAEGDERPDDWCLDELSDPPSEEEQTALSIDGVERKDPENLQAKSEVGYQCGPLERQQCGNCAFYIDDRSGDAIGACTEVEGMIRSVDWCGLWAAREKMGVDGDT